MRCRGPQQWRASHGSSSGGGQWRSRSGSQRPPGLRHQRRAAARCYLSCEELVETSAFDDAQLARVAMPIERSLLSVVVESPWGAHPTSCASGYGIDAAHLKEYSATAAERIASLLPILRLNLI